MTRTHGIWAALAAVALAGVVGTSYVVSRTANVDSASAVEVDCEKAGDKCDCVEKQAAQALRDCRSDRALTLVTSVNEQCKANPNIVAIQAEALANSGHHPAATSLAREVLKTSSQNRFARRALAISAIAQRDFAEAESVLGGLLAEDPKDAASVYYTALAAARRDRYNDARQGFLKSLRLQKHHIDARYNLVMLTSEAGAHEEAVHHLERLKEIAPHNDARVSSASALVKARAGSPNNSVTLVREKPDAG